MSISDVLIVGGGAIGCSIAYHLAREGVSVTLLERDGIASHASGAAAGMLAPISESPDEGPFFQFAVHSLERMPALAEELRERSGVDPQYVPSGLIHAAYTLEEAERLRQRSARLAAHGLRWLDRQEALALEPRLNPANLHGALHSTQEGHVFSPQLTRAYAEAAVAMGARVLTGYNVRELLRDGDRVTGVRTEHGEFHAGTVVLATGAWTSFCSPWVRMELPVEPIRGQILALQQPEPQLSPILWGDGIYLVPKRDGSLVVGATEERAGFDCRTTPEAIDHLLAAAAQLAPSVAGYPLVRAWAGLRPDTPDHLPIIGPVPGVRGVLVAAGHYRNGVLLSPATGELVTEWVLREEAPARGKAFLPGRFLPESN